LPVSTGLSSTPYPTPGSDNCMMTFAAGNNVAAGFNRSATRVTGRFTADLASWASWIPV
jgi:hypothetical protein